MRPRANGTPSGERRQIAASAHRGRALSRGRRGGPRPARLVHRLPAPHPEVSACRRSGPEPIGDPEAAQMSKLRENSIVTSLSDPGGAAALDGGAQTASEPDHRRRANIRRGGCRHTVRRASSRLHVDQWWRDEVPGARGAAAVLRLSAHRRPSHPGEPHGAVPAAGAIAGTPLRARRRTPGRRGARWHRWGWPRRSTATTPSGGSLWTATFGL